MEREKMRVIAKRNFEHIIDATIGRPRLEGEEFEVDKDRAQLLKEHDLVIIVREEPIPEKVEIPKNPLIGEEVKTETEVKEIKKRGRKPKK